MADRILLLSDYSSYHLNLRDGFREIGLGAILVSQGDGYKELERDITFPDKNFLHGINQRLGNYYDLLAKMKSFVNYDYVLSVAPSFFWGKADKIFLPFLKKNNEKFIYNASGLDYIYFKAYHDGLLKEMGYHSQQAILDDFKAMSNISEFLDHSSKEAYEIQKHTIDRSDAITYCGYDYYICYKKFGFMNKPAHLVFLPVNMSKIDYPVLKPNSKSKKIRILLGIQKNKEHFKGTHLTLKALEEIKEIYKDLVEIHTATNLTFNEWIKEINKCDIYIDQPYSFDVGMAALYAMAYGKVVLTGAEYEAITLKGLSEVPYYNIRPDSNHIKEVLSVLIEKKGMLEEQGFKAREFIKKHHDHVKVATEYHNFLKTL